MAVIKFLFHIDAPREQVFEAIGTIHGLSNWWTVETSGDSSLNGVINFTFGKFATISMKVVEMESNRQVTWECVTAHGDWLGTKISFQLDENDNKTRVRFSHDGFTETGDHFASISFAWSLYMESLRAYCQTGTGKAFGSENFRK